MSGEVGEWMSAIMNDVDQHTPGTKNEVLRRQNRTWRVDRNSRDNQVVLDSRAWFRRSLGLLGYRVGGRSCGGAGGETQSIHAILGASRW